MCGGEGDDCGVVVEGESEIVCGDSGGDAVLTPGEEGPAPYPRAPPHPRRRLR